MNNVVRVKEPRQDNSLFVLFLITYSKLNLEEK